MGLGLVLNLEEEKPIIAICKNCGCSLSMTPHTREGYKFPRGIRIAFKGDNFQINRKSEARLAEIAKMMSNNGGSNNG